MSLQVSEHDPRVTPWIQTWTGTRFYTLEPNKHEIFIEDIAHSNGFLCRYVGHVSQFYSVAEHEAHIANYLYRVYRSHALAIGGLLHDSPETYMGDLTKPVKIKIPKFAEVEEKIWQLIKEKFCPWITVEDERLIKDADQRSLYTEAQALLRHQTDGWHLKYGPPGLACTIQGWVPEEAEQWWLETLHFHMSGMMKEAA